MLSRISDDSYQFTYVQNGDKVDCIIRLKNRDQNQAVNSKIVKALAKKIISDAHSPYYVSDNSTIRLHCGDIDFEATATTNKLKGLISHLFPMVLNNTNRFHQEWEVSITGKTAQKGSIREYSLTYISPSLDTLSFFDDPFTSLSKKAFQKLEPSLLDQDNEGNSDFDTQTAFILSKNNTLSLVSREKGLSLDYSTERERAIHTFQDSLKQIYGEKKVSDVQIRYQVNLTLLTENNQPLTPEHVYRMNIGLAQLECQDIDRFLESLSRLQQQYHSQEYIQLFPQDRERIQRCIEKSEFSLRELKALVRLLGVDRIASVSSSAIEALFVQLADKKAVESLSLSVADRVIGAFAFTENEYKNACTGKEIYGFIKSSYTRAEVRNFKPWVDHQELIQTYPRLTKNWEQFHELLGHVIAKKHLFYPQSEGGFSVGTLIPCPASKDKISQWYRVTSCVHNGHGILSYTLEPACTGSELEVIKLYRSTASDPYNLNAKGSILNDINPFNSPGYMGTGLTDIYEKKFFVERTIPIWSAYEHLAEKLLEKEALQQSDVHTCFHLLSEANELLLEEVTSLYGKQDLRSLLKKWDFLFIDLLFSTSTPLTISEKGDIFLIIHKHIFSTDSKSQEVKEDAITLFKMLKKVAHQPSVEEFRRDLFNHLITGQRYALRLFKTSELAKEILDEVNMLRDNLKKLLEDTVHRDDAKIQSSAISLLQLWQKRLQAHAIEKNEHITQKKSQSVTFSGHSLGGACAQRHLVHFYTDRLRVNLPGTKISLKVFDDPAINSEDNAAFKEFGNRHCEVLNSLNISFEIIRRHEAFDIVTTAGEEHLGSTFSDIEKQQVSQWLRFDAAVQKTILTAKTAAIRQSPIAHGTQFEEGQREKGAVQEALYEVIDLLPKENYEKNQNKDSLLESYKKLQESIQGDFSRSWFDTAIQGDYDRGSNQVYKYLWQVMINPHTSEVLRARMLGILGSWFLTANQQESTLLQEQWQQFQDEKGCFAIHEKVGVVSSRTGVKN